MSSSTSADTIKFEGSEDEQTILRYSYGCRQEAYEAKRDRMMLNRINYDTYNLKGDFSHKKAGQSTEFLPKQMMATEQIASFMHQAMIDAGTWFSIDTEEGVQNPKISAHEMTLLTNRQLRKIQFDQVVEDAIKMGLLGSLMIAKVHGEYVERAQYETQIEDGPNGTLKRALYRKKKMVWQARVDLVRQEDYYPDPTGDGLYEMQQIEMDLARVKKLADGQNPIYDMEVVNQIVGGFEDVEQVGKKARETAQNQTFTNLRKRVRIWEFWGTILHPETGEILHENVTWTVANDRYLIRKPTKSPFWHGQSPFVVSPIIRLPKSVWHKALMDGPTALNNALNELFNLQLDAGIMSTWGIRQLRTDWLADETKYSDGIPPGETIEVNANCPPGQKVLEPVQTTVMSPETAATYQATNAEFQQASLTNDLRMGVLPSRQVKATEVVEASQTITSMFTGIAKVVEQNFVVKVLEKLWPTIAQNMNDLDDKEIAALFGPDRALEIHALTNEEIFQETVEGFKYKVFGISETLNKMKSFKALTALLQSIGSSEVLIEEFVKKYDFGRLLDQLMKSLDIDTATLEIPKVEQMAMQMQAGAMQPGATQPGTTPNMQSQIGAAHNEPSQAGGPQPAANSMVPQAKFPPSRALQAQGK